MPSEPGCPGGRVLHVGHLLHDEKLSVLQGADAFLDALVLELRLLEDLDVGFALLGQRAHVAALVIGQCLALYLELLLRGLQLVGEKLRGSHGLLFAQLQVLLDKEGGELVGHDGHGAGVRADVTDGEVARRFGGALG